MAVGGWAKVGVDLGYMLYILLTQRNRIYILYLGLSPIMVRGEGISGWSKTGIDDHGRQSGSFDHGRPGLLGPRVHRIIGDWQGVNSAHRRSDPGECNRVGLPDQLDYLAINCVADCATTAGDINACVHGVH